MLGFQGTQHRLLTWTSFQPILGTDNVAAPENRSLGSSRDTLCEVSRTTKRQVDALPVKLARAPLPIKDPSADQP